MHVKTCLSSSQHFAPECTPFPHKCLRLRAAMSPHFWWDLWPRTRLSCIQIALSKQGVPACAVFSFTWHGMPIAPAGVMLDPWVQAVGAPGSQEWGGRLRPPCSWSVIKIHLICLKEDECLLVSDVLEWPYTVGGEEVNPPPPPQTPGVDIIVTTLPRWGWGGGVEPGGSDDGMTITICSFYSFIGTDDSELQAILAKCVKK